MVGAPTLPLAQTISKLGKKTAVSAWWKTASAADRADLVAYLSDTTGAEQPTGVIEELLAGLSEDELEQLDKLTFASGRAAYSRETLRRLNQEMRASGCDLHQAVMNVFDAGPDWAPPLDTFAVRTGNPRVDRNLVLLELVLSAIREKYSATYGEPEFINIEVARELTLGRAMKAKRHAEQLQRQAFNDQLREELRDGEHITHPTNRDIQRKRLMQIQNSTCAYCGATLEWKSCEIDHIVSRASGGSSRRSNLVLACMRCNREKGRLPFGAWAPASERPEVSLEAAIDRVKGWLRIENDLDAKAFAKYKYEVIRRLRRTSDDEELDERSLQTTAYAATAARDRAIMFLAQGLGGDLGEASRRVRVYAGGITAIARKAGCFETVLSLRGDAHKTRFDRRHHAIDALVLATLTDSVARVLVQRDDMRDADRLRLEPTGNYKEYRGHWGDQVNYERWLEVAEKAGELGHKLIEEDGIPVVYPHRLGTNAGAVHEATVRPVLTKKLGEAWSEAELMRVVDRRVYTNLLAERQERGSLIERVDRELTLGRTRLTAKDRVEIFWALDEAGIPKPMPASLKVRGGAVRMGSIHHARIFAWRETKGKAKGELRYGMMRVFVGDFARIGFLRREVDVFTEPLPVWSESYRLSNATLLARIEDGSAKQIGRLVQGDELVFAPGLPLPGTGREQVFADWFPDRRFVVSGFEQPLQINLQPAYLSTEETPDGLPVDAQALLLDGKGWRSSASLILARRDLRIVQRTPLGRERLTYRGFATSWSPKERAEKLLGP